MKIIKLSRFEEFKRNKIFDLIRLTRINSVLAKRRYLHYILLCWLAYTRNMNRKRKQVKALYENMLNTYMHMADDVFGNNQKENPSVQDALFEAVESDKFQTKNLNDVPVAEKYYEEKKEIKKVTTNITIVNNTNPINEPKEYVTYKAYISSNQPLPLPLPLPLTTSPSTGNIKGQVIKEKIITVLPGERLQSRGRGRKYRTKNEREILNKFYQDKKIYTKMNKYNNKEEEKEDDEKDIQVQGKYTGNIDVNNNDNFEGNYKGNYGGKYGGSKRISIKISTNKTNNNLGGSYNYSLNMNDSDLNNSKNKNIKEMSYRKRRALFGMKYKKEDEKEMEDEK